MRRIDKGYLQRGTGLPARPSLPLVALAALAAPAMLAALVLLPAPAAAGELRAVVEATAGLREDGNYFQSEVVPPNPGGPDDPEDPENPEPDDENLDSQVAVAGLRASLSYLLPRKAFALVYAPSWERNLDYDDIGDDVAHRLDLGYTAEASRISRISIRERLLYSPNVELSPSFLDDTLVVTRRSDQLRHAFSMDVATNMTRQWILNFGISHTYRNYEAPELIDTWSAGSTVGLSYSVEPRTAWGFGVSYQVYDYDVRSDDVQSLFGTYRVELVRDLDLNVSAGVFRVEETRERLIPGPVPTPGPQPTPQIEEPLGETEEVRNGWQGGFGLAGSRERFSWTVGYDHGVNPGYSLGRSVESDRVRAGIAVPLTRRIGFGLNGTATRNSDLDPDSDEAAGSDINEFAAGNASLDWAFANWGRVSGNYSRVWQESEIEALSDLSYDRFTIGIAVRLYATGETPIEPGKEGEARDVDPDVP